MLALAFAEKTLSGLVFSALVVGIATYFGQPFIFDPIVLMAFVAIAIAFRRNIDLVSICAIFIAERGLEELMWRFMEYTISFKIPFYLVFLLIPLFFCKGPLRLLLTAFVTTGIFIELYWHLTSYDAPKILWNFYLLAIAIIIRRVLIMRTFWLIEMNPRLEPKPIALDSQLLIANAGFIVLHCLMIAEYWLRHILQLSDLLYVYYSFSYITHILSMFMLYMIVVQSIYHLREIELSA